MSFDVNSAVWMTSNSRVGRGKQTVSEKVDVYIGHNSNKACKTEYMSVRFYGKKYAEVFGKEDMLSVGFIGNYLLVKPGDGYKVYNLDTNPEIRVPITEVQKCGRNAEKLMGGYLLKWDDIAKIAYIDTVVGARA